jgi:hypothetical protein
MPNSGAKRLIVIIAYISFFKPSVGGGKGGANSPRISGLCSSQILFIRCPTCVVIIAYFAERHSVLTMLLYIENICCEIYRFWTCQNVWILKIPVIVCMYELEFKVFSLCGPFASDLCTFGSTSLPAFCWNEEREGNSQQVRYDTSECRRRGPQGRYKTTSVC